MKDRLLQIMQEKHLTSSKLADVISVQRSSISHILSGRNKPSMDFLLKILTVFPEISGDWLITGQGEMYKDPYQKTSTSMTDSASVEINDLFETSHTPAKTQEQKPTPKEVQNAIANQTTLNEKPFPTKAKTVKRVVIYYDDNSYDELFLPN